jgi:uncharacterized protein YraI
MVSMRSGLTVAATFAAMVSGAGAAAASPGYVTTSLNLRAGPSTSYPAVVVMHAGDRVEIYGCLTGWSWCDIDWHGYRGWAAGRYLQVLYERQRRPIVSYGARFRIPFLSFSIGNYWNQHYHNRPFFKELPKFERRPPRDNPPLKGPPPKGPPFKGKPPIFKGPPQGGPPPGSDFKPPKGPPKFFKGSPKGPQGGPPPRNGFKGSPKFFKGPPGGSVPGGSYKKGGSPGGQGCPPGQHFRNGGCK